MKALATALDVSLLAREDLTSYQIKRGKYSGTVNRRLSQAPRGLMNERADETFENSRVAIRDVRAAYTSHACPYCGERNSRKRAKITHPTYRRSACQSCARSGGRDEWAALTVGLDSLRARRLHSVGHVSVRTRVIRARQTALHPHQQQTLLPASHWRIVSLREHSAGLSQGVQQASRNFALNHNISGRNSTS